jgi:hypothetical protein
MAIAQGVSKQVRFKVQSALGVAAGTSLGEILRRVTSDINLTKETYQSQEIRADAQVADFRHGVRDVSGSVKGETSPGSYDELIAASLRKDFAAVTAISSLSVTIAGVGPYTITRAAGSWIADGVKGGHVVRLTAGALNAANLNKNLLVLGVTSATVLSVTPLNGVALFAEGPIASSTLSFPGKVTYAPTTALTTKYFTFEHWFADIAQSEQFTDCKIGGFEIGLPATGISTISLDVKGLNMATATSAYFTSPSAASTTGVVAAVNGVLAVNGTALAVVTGLTIKVNNNLSNDPVVGSNVKPDVFNGRTMVDGQFTAYFENATLRDLFINETESTLMVALTTSNAAAADFIAFTLPRIKVGSATKDDGEKGLVQTFSFTALLNVNSATNNFENTTMQVQDSLAT